MKVHSKGWLLLTAIVVIAAAAAATGGLAIAGSTDNPASAKGLGPLTGLLPRDHLTVESALQVDLSKESVRLPLYKGKANGETVWYVLVDASDQGIAVIVTSMPISDSESCSTSPVRRSSSRPTT